MIAVQRIQAATLAPAALAAKPALTVSELVQLSRAMQTLASVADEPGGFHWRRWPRDRRRPSFRENR